jgi:2-polyprenyl-3-methyl-5-hydroxy-6-metoxy-1,4-benzoquinol methylase
MTRLDEYSLGYRQAELQRLQRQAEQLGGESMRLFDEIGIADGARVLEIGCGPRGCLDLLAARVGVTGHVVGVELNPELAALAQTFVAANGIHNVDIRAGDARSVGLDEESFDLVTSRLVLVNIPQPEQVIAAAEALARPGGAVAFHEVDWAAFVCDPPSQEWSTAIELLLTASKKSGADYFLGRRLPRLLRQAGLEDIRVHPIIHVHPLGDSRRTLLLDFVDNFKHRILELELASEAEIAELKVGLATHLENPETGVFIGPYIQAWGRKPA